MANAYFSPRFGAKLDSTGSCRNTAENGDDTVWFTEERNCLHHITKICSLTGQRMRENLFCHGKSAG